MKSLIHTLLPRKGMRQAVKFGLVGLCNTSIDYGVYLVLTRIFFTYVLVANAFAMACAMTFSFFANRHFTFRQSNGDIKAQMGRFVVVQGVGFILANTIFYLSVVFGVYDIFAKIMGSVIFTIWNFLAQKYWAFREEGV